MDWWVALKLPGGEDLAYLDSAAAASDADDARFMWEPTPALLHPSICSTCRPLPCGVADCWITGDTMMGPMCRHVSGANTSLSQTLQQLYAGATQPEAGAPGHIMYSDQPPLVDPLGDEGSSAAAAFTRGKGVMVRAGPEPLNPINHAQGAIEPVDTAMCCSCRHYHLVIGIKLLCIAVSFTDDCTEMPSTAKVDGVAAEDENGWQLTAMLSAGLRRGARLLAGAQHPLLPTGAQAVSLHRCSPSHPAPTVAPTGTIAHALHCRCPSRICNHTG